jgi:hypothetical protein
MDKGYSGNLLQKIKTSEQFSTEFFQVVVADGEAAEVTKLEKSGRQADQPVVVQVDPENCGNVMVRLQGKNDSSQGPIFYD